jgi:hypothetical protein
LIRGFKEREKSKSAECIAKSFTCSKREREKATGKDKCGHQLYIEQPDSFNDFVLRMIDPKKNAAFRKPVLKK